MQRRSFLSSILAAGVAPAAVGSGILMPVRALWIPDEDWIYPITEALHPVTDVEFVTGWEWRQEPMEFIDLGLVELPRWLKL